MKSSFPAPSGEVFPTEPCPIPASLRQLMTHSASGKSFAAVVLLGWVCGLGMEEEEVEEEEASDLQAEAIQAAKSTDQTDPCDELQGILLPCSGRCTPREDGQICQHHLQ